jgi:hypothetical protein
MIMSKDWMLRSQLQTLELDIWPKASLKYKSVDPFVKIIAVMTFHTAWPLHLPVSSC